MGHENVLTTFRSYGSVATGRQIELMDRFRKLGPVQDVDDNDLIEAGVAEVRSEYGEITNW